MSGRVEVPLYPGHEAGPCVVKISVITNGRQIIGEYAVEVPITIIRNTVERIELHMELMAAAGSAPLAIAVNNREVAEAQRREFVDSLAALGHSALALKFTGWK